MTRGGRLRPFFSFYGAKWQLAPRYPAPAHGTIVEPFAGSACYSLLHHERDVVLVERDPNVAAVWRYLLAATRRDVLALPVELLPGWWDDPGLDVGARFLIGFNLGFAAGWPKRAPTPCCAAHPRAARKLWGTHLRRRVADQVERIRHWTLIEGDYTLAPDVQATWFVDPPYRGRPGARYRYGSGRIDYGHLATWCRDRRGDAMVCERYGADWLPFRYFAAGRNNQGRASSEALYRSGDPTSPGLFDAHR